MERGRVLRRPHFLSNANTALQFLASKRIKLVNINPADLVDGRPPVVLGLIWTIILYFQVSLISNLIIPLFKNKQEKYKLVDINKHSVDICNTSELIHLL